MGNQLNRVLDALDGDHNGNVSPAELKAWIDDEKFSNQSIFTDEERSGLVKLVRTLEAEYAKNPEHREEVNRDQQNAVLKLMDDKTKVPSAMLAGGRVLQGMTHDTEYRKISREEFSKWFESLPQDSRDKITTSLLKENRSRKRAVLVKIYQSIDVDKSGTVEPREICEWLEHEKAIRSIVHSDRKMRQLERSLLKRMDQDKSGDVSFDEFERVFGEWSLRELRNVTRDLMRFRGLSVEQRQSEVVRANSSSNLLQGQ